MYCPSCKQELREGSLYCHHCGEKIKPTLAAESRESSIKPWLTIWVSPRGTIRKIVDTNPTRHVLLLAALAGFASSLDRVSKTQTSDSLSLPLILILCAVFGPIGGIISLYIGAAILRATGAMLGGEGTATEVRAAIAWSSVPQIVGLLLWIPMFLLLGDEAIKNNTPRFDALLESNPMLGLIIGLMLLGIAGVSLIIGIWNIFIFLKCLAEVHRFSIWRALGASAIPFAVLLVPIMCIAGLALFGPEIGKLLPK